MAGVNKSLFIGNLTADPEVRDFDSGNSVCQFSIAVNERFKGKDGEVKEKTSFIPCKAWGRHGQNIAAYMAKGSRMYVEGSMDTETWEDRHGNEKSRLVLNVRNSMFLDPKGSVPQSQTVPKDAPPPGAPQEAVEPPLKDDNIPF